MKKTLSVLLSLLMIVSTISALPITAHALSSGKCGDYVTYTFDSSTGTLKLEGGHNLYDYAWGESPFFGNKAIKKVVVVDKFTKGIPFGRSGYVEAIGSYVFAKCENLESVELASSNGYIGKYAFYGCTKLYDITLPNGIGWIDEGAFAGCVNITDVKLRKNMTVIKKKAFADCAGLKTVTISGNIKTIEDDAFINCTKLTDVYYLGTDAQWDAMTIGKNNTCLTGANIHHYEEGSCGTNVTYHMDFNTGTMTISGKGDMADYDLGKAPPWDQYRGKITTLIVEEGVTKVGQIAFDNCYYLTTVSIPASVESIGYLAFEYSNAITEVYYSSSETNWNAVKGKADLNKGTVNYNSSIPLASGKCGENATYTIDTNHQLTISGTDAMYDFTDADSPFAGNTEIASVVIEDGITSIGDWSFAGCTGITSVTLADTVSTIGINAFRQCTGLQSFDIPDSITELGNLAFAGCSGITSIKLPKELTAIGNNAFENCTALSKVNIPENVKTIGSSAFKGCSGLADLTIAEGVLVISESAFQSCLGLTEIEIPDSVTSISNRAFAGCTNLTTAYIGSGVKTIGSNVFQNDKKLTDIYYSGTQADWNSIAIATPNSVIDTIVSNNALHVYPPVIESGTCGDSANWSFDTSTGVLTISGTGDMADYSSAIPEFEAYKNDITSIVIKNGITGIGKHAFLIFPAVTEVSIPDSVTEIGEKAFKNCVALATVTIGSGVTSIGTEAFDGCSSLTTVNYTGTDEAWNTISIGTNNAPLLAVKPQAIGFADGTCGEDLTYSFDSSTHTLTISGTGAMTNFAKMTDSPFYHKTEIQSVVIEDGVTTIGQFAFAYCSSLTSITIPASVTRIYAKAFIGTGLTDIHFMGTEAQWDELAAATSSTGNDKIKSATKHYRTAFDGKCGENATWSLDTNIGILTISGTGPMEDYDAYYPEYENYKDNITSIVIEDGVTYISKYAFYKYSNVTSVTIPTTITAIGDNAFYDCDAITSVNYSGTDEQWQNIDLGYGNGSLTAIRPHDISGSCGDTVRYTLKGDGTLIIHGTGAMDDFSKSNPEYASFRDDIKKIVIEDGVTYIGIDAFYALQKVTSVTIADSVTEIAAYAFWNCIALTSISISKNVTTIGEDIFAGCNGLTSIHVDSLNPNYSSLDGVLFNKDKTILMQYPRAKAGASYSIPESVTVIGDSALGHTALESIIIPDSVKTIGDYAFSSCESLKSVVIGNGVTDIGTSAFTYCDALRSVTLGNSVTNIGVTAFFDCKSLESINIPDSVTGIGADAFGFAGDTFTVTAGCHHPLVPAILEGTNRVWNKTHTYTPSVTPATLKKNGSIDTKCVCGDIQSTKTIDYPKTIALSAAAYTYDGKAKKPSVRVKDAAGKVIPASNYTVSYAKGRKAIGAYTVTVQFKGNYSGTKKLSFKINPKGTSLKKVTKGKKSFTVTWKKQAKQTTGYQIQYSTDKKFKKGCKTVTVKKNKTVKTTVKKLKAKKKYYVRIRTYKTVGKTKYYSSWSKAKSVKTK